jgi:hypothetical protein
MCNKMWISLQPRKIMVIILIGSKRLSNFETFNTLETSVSPTADCQDRQLGGLGD